MILGLGSPLLEGIHAPVQENSGDSFPRALDMDSNHEADFNEDWLEILRNRMKNGKRQSFPGTSSLRAIFSPQKKKSFGDGYITGFHLR